jgi:pimeloyl-[acyl-carrier protein] synthase
MVSAITTMNTAAQQPATAFRFNPFASGFIDDPYPTFRWMRENDPVHKYRTLIDDAWILTRHADIRAVLTDKRFGIEDLDARVVQKIPFMQKDAPSLRRLGSALGSWLFSLNPPDHGRLRHIVSRDFTAAALARVRPVAETFVDDAFATLLLDGSFDLMVQIARPLPAVVTAAVLGLQSDRIGELITCSERLFSIFEQPITFDGYRSMGEAADTFREFFEAEFAARASEAPKNDLLGKLLLACGKALSHDEVIAFSAMLFSVGQETTENYIGNSALALLRQRDQFDALVADPAMIPAAALELARYDSAVQFISRVPLEDVEIGGHTLRRNDRVYLALGAANRDPDAFDAPDDLDLARSETSNLPFGSGIHFCLGSALARLMVEVVLERLVRYPSIAIDDAGLVRRRTVVLRGIRTLPLHLPERTVGAGG